MYEQTSECTSCNYVYKVKVNLALYLTEYHAMKTYGGVEIQLHAYLASSVGGDESSALLYDLFISRESAPGTH
jgi:hypothetical protein